MSRTIVRVETRQVVYSRNYADQLIGPHAPDGSEIFTPWKWNDRLWTSYQYENSDLSIPVLGDASTRSIPDSFWQSGVGDLELDLKLKNFKKLFKNSKETWTFNVRHGTYFKYKEERFLFSDRSIIQKIDNDDNIDDRNVITLSFTPRLGTPILARMWKRGVNGVPGVYAYVYKYINFSGSYTEDGESSTNESNGDIIWDNVDTSKNEFVIDWDTNPPKLYFNNDYTFLIGKTTINEDDDLEYCEALGESDGTENQVFFTDFFPMCDSTELQLYVNNYSTTKTVYDPVAETGDYAIDIDRGEITFVDKNGDTLWLPSAGDKLYLRYRPTLEIEYESEHADNFRTAPVVDLNPVNSFNDNGFIYLSEQELRVAYLELEASTTVIDSDTHTYGPLYLGTDFCLLHATAYNIYEQPVPGATVTFYIREAEAGDGGRLNGALTSVSAITNGNGIATIVYTTPRSVESLGQYMEHPGTDASNKLKLVYTNGIEASNLDQLYVYQVYDDDGHQPWYSDVTEDGEPGHGGKKVVLYYWDDDAIHPRTHLDGAYTPARPVSLEKIGLDTWLVFENPLETPLSLPVTTGSLVSYWVSGGKEVAIYAECYSYLYNNNVYSNDVNFRLEIPEFLQGVYVSEELEGNIPYGFRLYDLYGTAASGIDGATFISINPVAGSHPILWDGEETGIREDQSLGTGNILGHQFTIPE